MDRAVPAPCLSDATLARPIRFVHAGHGFEIWAGIGSLTQPIESEREIRCHLRIDGVASYKGPVASGRQTLEQVRPLVIQWWDDRHRS